MSKFILDRDVNSVQTVHFNADGSGVVKTTENIQPLIDVNAQKLSDSSASWQGDFHHVASIPQVVMNVWSKELGDDPTAKRNHKWLLAKLNNSDWAKLRTKAGNL